jgi:type III pantothenate kinase
MKPDVVVDVGNTRIKWGRCSAEAVEAQASLPPDDPAAWQAQVVAWCLRRPAAWALTGVHPPRRDRLLEWLRARGDTVQLIESADVLPLRVLLPEPGKVGIDRLFNAVAANQLRALGGPAVIVGAGTAVTVDLVDESGAFRGGAILPGLRLMTQALHDHTALLPLVPPSELDHLVDAPGRSTTAAIRAGVFWAVAGGVRALIEQYARNTGAAPAVFVTGGDGGRIWPAVGGTYAPALTLQGIRLTAERLP